jgi:hypothetical protein
VDDLADVLKRLSRLERAVGGVVPAHIWAAIAEQDQQTLPPVPRAPEPAASLLVMDVANSLGISDQFGQTRAVLEAWALAHGLPVTGTHVPSDALPELRTVHQARASGKSWRAAILAAGLTVPDENTIAKQALQARLEGAALVQYLADLAQAVLEREGGNPHARAGLRTALDTILGAGA